MTTAEEVRNELSRRFPVTKDIGSIRRKGGPFLEDICQAIKDHYPDSKFVIVESWSSRSSVDAYCYLQCTKEIGLYWFGARAGVPTLVVGVLTKEDWLNLRTWLRSQKLIR